jgi:hypothetical protein
MRCVRHSLEKYAIHNLLPVFDACCNQITMEDKVTHSLTCTETPLSIKSLVPLTPYWSWNFEIIIQNKFSITYCCYNTVWTPTLCKPDTLDRPLLFSFNLLNLATPLLSYAVRLVLLILVLLSSLLCYLYDAILILTSDILYSLIDMFLSILRYISTHVFVVEP